MCNCLEGQIIVAMVIEEDKPQLKDLHLFSNSQLPGAALQGKREGLPHP